MSLLFKGGKKGLADSINTKEFGAKLTNSTAQNRAALQAAIVMADSLGRGVVVVDYDVPYGLKTRTPSTYPNFLGVNNPIMVMDYSKGDTQLPSVYPVAFDGAQVRIWTNTPQTTSPGQHDGNTQWLRGGWAPAYCVSNDMDLTGARLASDNRRAGFATMVNGSAAWQFMQGTRTGAALTDEDLSNMAIQKFALPGDTLGAYTPYNVERKTGNVSYGGGRNIPVAHHHFEAVAGSPTLDLSMFESKGVTCTQVLRNVNGSSDDISIVNSNGDLVLKIPLQGDALTVSKASRKVKIATALHTSKNNITFSSSMTPDSNLANIFQTFAGNAAAHAINAPTSANIGQQITIRISNVSGGALGVATWNAIYKMAAWVQPANGYGRSITFFYDEATPGWIEISRTTVDIPN